jgi:hypothetical protein
MKHFFAKNLKKLGEWLEPSPLPVKSATIWKACHEGQSEDGIAHGLHWAFGGDPDVPENHEWMLISIWHNTVMTMVRFLQSEPLKATNSNLMPYSAARRYLVYIDPNLVTPANAQIGMKTWAGESVVKQNPHPLQ